MSDPSTARCPICEGPARHHVRARDHLYGNAGTWDLFRCDACGHGFQHPLPEDDAAMASCYSDQYYAYAAPATDLSPRGLRRRGIWLMMHHLKRSAGYTHLPVRSSWLLARLGRRLFSQPLGFDTPRYRPGGRLLDFGSGSGGHVARMAFLGWNAEGLEIDDKAAAAGRSVGLAVARGSVETLEGRPRRYDEIRASHSVEHVVDVRRLMRAALEALKPGGRLAVDVPNGDSAAFGKFGPHWLYLTLPVHVHIFSPRSIERLAREVGFEDIRLASYTIWSALARSVRLRRLGPAAGDGEILDQPASRVDRVRALPSRLRAAVFLRGDCLVMTARRPADS